MPKDATPATKTNPGPLLRGLPRRRRDRARGAAHRVGRGTGAVPCPLPRAACASIPRTSFARACGLPESPIDDLAAFHIVFGKSVPDVSLNAVANLGYAEARWLRPVYAGDTIRAFSEVIGLKQNSSGKTGVVYVRTTGRKPARAGGDGVRPLGHGAQARH